jgi:hypothetical protein
MVLDAMHIKVGKFIFLMRTEFPRAEFIPMYCCEYFVYDLWNNVSVHHEEHHQSNYRDHDS